MAFARFACERALTRVIRRPRAEKGRVEMYVCGEDGVGDMRIAKRDAQAFRAARKADSGDALPVAYRRTDALSNSVSSTSANR